MVLFAQYKFKDKICHIISIKKYADVEALNHTNHFIDRDIYQC